MLVMKILGFLPFAFLALFFLGTGIFIPLSDAKGTVMNWDGWIAWMGAGIFFALCAYGYALRFLVRQNPPAR